MIRGVVCVFLVAAVFAGHHDKYEGHKLYRVGGPVEELTRLEDVYQLDILSATPAARSSSGQLEALVKIPPQEVEQWLAYFGEKGMTYSKIVDNLADVFRKEEEKIADSRKNIVARGDEEDNEGWSVRWDTYYRSQEINDQIDELGAKYPDLVTVMNAALSYEGRQIKYVRISTSRFEDLRKPLIVIDSAIHAREWITPPVAMYIINQLVVDIVDSDLVERLDWVIFPMLNPDGYDYSIDEDRLWRKTRSLSHPGAEECPGVDGNRNYDHLWGTMDSAANPCALTFEGPAAFSESETRVVRDVVNQQLSRTAMYISLHSFGNMFLYAWGNNGTLPSNGLSLHLAGIRMATAIDALALDKADRYIVGNAAQVLYYSTGTSRDWTRAVGVPLTYTLELPGYDYGFLVPPEYIKQVVTETWAGILEGAKYVIEIYYY